MTRFWGEESLLTGKNVALLQVVKDNAKDDVALVKRNKAIQQNFNMDEFLMSIKTVVKQLKSTKKFKTSSAKADLI